MALKTDVLVVGGGLAGACAAFAARAGGREVLLVARAPGATAVSSGCVDVASERDRTIGDAARALAARPDHPYALFGDGLAEAIDAALDLLRKHLPELRGARTAADRNLWIATPLGRARPAALALAPIAAGDLRSLPKGARLGVAALAGAQVVQARFLARALDALLAPAATAVVLPLDAYTARTDHLRGVAELAADLDRPGRAVEVGASIARAARLAGVTHVLLPAVGPSGETAALEAAAGLPIFELPGQPPSAPGLRLHRAIERALSTAGVQRLDAIAERAADGGLQLIRGLEADRVEARAVVLATGRFLAGGIRADGEPPRLREATLGLPAFAGGRRDLPALPTEELFANRARGPHPGLAAGLRATPELRALGEGGLPASVGGAPVFAAGAVLGGFDPARGDGGLGVCAVTGCAAGRAAAKALS